MKKISKCIICDDYLGDYGVSTEYFKFIERNDKIGDLEGFVCKKCTIRESGVKTLYHISNDCDIIDDFIPRIPLDRAIGEDSLTPRISLSSTLEGCLTAVPWGNSRLDMCFWDQESTFLLRVYEFDISELKFEKLVPPEYLYFKNLVTDAYNTKEYWYLEEIEPSKTYLIEVKNYAEEEKDFVICEDIMEGLREDAKGNYGFDWDAIIDGHFTSITFLEYEIIPENRRSGLFQLSHVIKGVNLIDFEDVENDILGLYPLNNTFICLEEKDNIVYLTGQVETRWTGNLESSGEVDTEKIIGYFNDNLNKGEILEGFI